MINVIVTFRLPSPVSREDARRLAHDDARAHP